MKNKLSISPILVIVLFFFSCSKTDLSRSASAANTAGSVPGVQSLVGKWNVVSTSYDALSKDKKVLASKSSAGSIGDFMEFKPNRIVDVRVGASLQSFTYEMTDAHQLKVHMNKDIETISLVSSSAGRISLISNKSTSDGGSFINRIELSK